MIKRILLSLLIILHTIPSFAGTHYIRNDATKNYIQAQNNTGLVGQWSLGTADINGSTIYGK